MASTSASVGVSSAAFREPSGARSSSPESVFIRDIAAAATDNRGLADLLTAQNSAEALRAWAARRVAVGERLSRSVLLVRLGEDIAAIDEALRLEMLAREVVSRIQGLRKESDLTVTDRVDVSLTGVSEGLRGAVEAHRGYISAEVLAASILVEGPENGASDTLEVDGETARIFVRKVG